MAVTFTAICSVIALITWPLSPSGRLLMWYAKKWSSLLLKICGIRLTIKGAELIDWNRTYLIMTNHKSYFDIPVLISSLPITVRMLAKRSLGFIPFFGWCMHLAGFVFIDRSRMRRAMQSLNAACEKIKQGNSMVVFPEGTRVKGKKIGEFKRGVFILATRAKAPLLPVGIRGTDDILAPDEWLIKPGKIQVNIGQPIEIESMGEDDTRLLSSIIHHAIRMELENSE
jgi:1-acyl-sn-glycerol-3-phosphate acyltransferase